MVATCWWRSDPVARCAASLARSRHLRPRCPRYVILARPRRMWSSCSAPLVGSGRTAVPRCSMSCMPAPDVIAFRCRPIRSSGSGSGSNRVSTRQSRAPVMAHCRVTRISGIGSRRRRGIDPRPCASATTARCRSGSCLPTTMESARRFGRNVRPARRCSCAWAIALHDSVTVDSLFARTRVTTTPR